jgi:dienelactone hydrolase
MPEVPENLDSGQWGGVGPFTGLSLAGKPAAPGVVLMHGRNSHPDGTVVGFLRHALHQEGFTTLSIANPVPRTGDEFADYSNDLGGSNFVFPEARARLKAALKALEEQRISTRYLLGFSMGARLMSAYLASSDSTQFRVQGFIALSIGVNGPGPLNCTTTLPRVSVPVLDICGEADADVSKSAPQRRSSYAPGAGRIYEQVVLPGNVPHNFAGSEREVLHRMLDWLSVRESL